jgi:hypothetical protein
LTKSYSQKEITRLPDLRILVEKNVNHDGYPRGRPANTNEMLCDHSLIRVSDGYHRSPLDAFDDSAVHVLSDLVIGIELRVLK